MSILPEIPPDGLLEAMAGAHEVSPCHDLIGPMEAAYHAMRDWLSASAVAGQVDDNTILPCPFCGGNAINSQVAGTATVECRDCRAMITIIGGTTAVIAEWNRRTHPDGTVTLPASVLEHDALVVGDLRRRIAELEAQEP